MINEEKVVLMTRAALYEKKAGKKELKITSYFRHDYVSLQVLSGWFFMSVCFVLGALLWGFCNMEYLLDNIHKMDLKSFGTTAAMLYILLAAAYGCIVFGVSFCRYYIAKRNAGAYGHTLKKISNIYTHEARNAASGSTTKEF